MTTTWDESAYAATTPADGDDGEPPSQTIEWRPTGHELLIIITLAVVSLLVALDASIIVTSLGAMVTDLQANTTEGFWIGTSYLLVNAVTMPVIASLSEIFGRPICLEFALVMFTIGTIFCCAAHNVTVMLVGRCVQGIGGGGVHVLSGVIMTDLVPLRYRPKWFGIVLAAWALGTCIGPLIGGAIVQNTTWRWVFYLMFPICAYGLVAVPALLTLTPKVESFRDKLLRVDWFGSFIFIASATSFLIAICWGGTQEPWNSAATIAPLVLGILGLGVTVIWEVRFAKEPIFKRELFHDVSSTVAYICGAAQGFLMWGPFYYYPLYFLSVMQTTPVNAGVNLLPAVLVLIPGSIISGRLVTRFNNYRAFVWGGWFLVTIFGVLSVEWRFIDVTTVVWVVTEMVFGFGQGAVLNAQQFATQAMCPAGDEGHAAAMYLFMRQFGAAIGVGVGGTAFQNCMALKLDWEGLPTEIASQAEYFIAKLHTLPDDSDYKIKIIEAYKFGFAGVFQVYLGVSAVALILSILFIKHRSLDKTLDTQHTLRDSRASKLLMRDSRVSMQTPTPWHNASDTESYNPRPHQTRTDEYDPNMYYNTDGTAYTPAIYQPEAVPYEPSGNYEDPNVHIANEPEASLYNSDDYGIVFNALPSAYHPEPKGYDPYSYYQAGMSQQR